jgi:hypothetical protein
MATCGHNGHMWPYVATCSHIVTTLWPQKCTMSTSPPTLTDAGRPTAPRCGILVCGSDCVGQQLKRSGVREPPLALAAKERHMFYVETDRGAGLRYHAGGKNYYINWDVVVNWHDTAK